MSVRCEVATSSMKTSPESGCSSRPAMCRSVDLPAPDGPTKATDWPGQTASSMFLRMSSEVSPCQKRLDISCRYTIERGLSAAVDGDGDGADSMLVVISSIAGGHSYRNAS